MATIYSAPESLKLPEQKDFESPIAFEAAEEKFLNDLKQYCKDNSKCPHAGEEIGFFMGDGQARYVVFNYRTLIHVAISDAYDISDAHARGIRKADILQKIKTKKAAPELKKLF